MDTHTPTSPTDIHRESFLRHLREAAVIVARHEHEAQQKTNPASPKGTPTPVLAALPDDQLVARYQTIRAQQAAPNYVPKNLRAAPSEIAKREHSILQSERIRIQRIARERGLDLTEQQTAGYIHTAYTSAERDPHGDVERGDTVDTEFRDPDTGEIVRGVGVIEKIESGKFGLIYYTRVGERTFPLSKRGIKKIILDGDPR